MPYCANAQRRIAVARNIAVLLNEAMRFVAPDRLQATCAKWLSALKLGGLGEWRHLCIIGDSTLLAADLLRATPSMMGSTAFDRLAKQHANATPDQKAAIAALRAASFRLLEVGSQDGPHFLTVRDLLTNASFRLVGPGFPRLQAGMALFGRVAGLDDDFCVVAGTITPLDGMGLLAARAQAGAKAGGGSAGIRWADAVYAHVVRNGTLDVPGLNRPQAGKAFLDEDIEPEPSEVQRLAALWEKLAGGEPGKALLERTRQLVQSEHIVDALLGLVVSQKSGQTAQAAALERILMVQLETVKRREMIGCGGMSLDAVAQAVAHAARGKPVMAEAPSVFAALCKRLTGSGAAAPGDSAELQRLMQKIQGLRAKTVEKGCTEQEALAAAEKVAELLDRYGLSLGEIDFRAQACEGIAVQTGRKRFGPVDDCVMSIAAFFDCRVWAEHTKGQPFRWIFFGLRADVAAAQYLHEMVERAFEVETDAFKRGPLYARMAGERRSATNSFQVGLASGIRAKLRTMLAARDAQRRGSSGRDLVTVKGAMVDDELAKLGLSLRRRGGGSSRNVLTEAFNEGEEAGKRFEFAEAISKAA